MPPEMLIEAVAPLIAFIGLGGAILIGMKLRYNHLERLRQGGSSDQDVEKLTDAVNTLRDEVHMLRDGYLELNERMEFTERLLERPKPDSEARRRQKD